MSIARHGVMFPAVLTAVVRRSRPLRLVAWAAVWGLVAFHVWLLAGDVARGALADPGQSLRWLAGAALTWGLIGCRRAGAGRAAPRVLWALVLLLHVAAPSPATFADETSASGALIFVLPTVGLAVAIVVRRGFSARARRAAEAPRTESVSEQRPRPARAADLFRPATPRPPPLAVLA